VHMYVPFPASMAISPKATAEVRKRWIARTGIL
jgi:hypothetical protein